MKHLSPLTRTSRRDVLKAAAVAGLSVMIGGTGLTGLAYAQDTRQIVVGLSQEPTNFHPLMPSIEVEHGVFWNLYSSLWGVNERGEHVPDLAVEVPTIANGGISADGLTWTVKLRDDVKWHDGEPFDAEDVRYSLELLRNPDFRAGTRNGHDLITTIEVVSPTEIRWTMNEPSASYHSVLSATFIVPEHVLSALDDVNSPAFAANPVGTGPFRWESRTAGDQIILARNDDYHGTVPSVERLVVKYVPDLTVMYTQFQTGAIDYVSIQGITPDRYAEASQLADRQLHHATMPNVETITLNLEHPPFKDKAVRQALYLAMDKDLIIDQIYYGIPNPAETYLPREARSYNPDLPAHEFDPDKARALLDEAGWEAGPDGIRSKDGVRLEFTLQAVSGNHLRAQLQQVLQQLWREIGVEVNLEQMPPAVLWADNWVYSQFQAIVAGTAFTVGGDADTTNYFSRDAIAAKGGTGLNNFQYVNDEVESLLAEGKKELDPARRDEIYRRQQEIIRDDLPFLPIYHWNVIEGTHAKLKGYESNINVTSNMWNLREWKWVD